MKRLRRLAAVLAVTVTVMGLASVATAASAQTTTRARTAQQDPCSGITPPSRKSLCEVGAAVSNVLIDLTKSEKPQSAASYYFDSFPYVKDCAPSFLKGVIGALVTLSQWKQIFTGILNLAQVQRFWDRYETIRDFPLTPFGGCFPPAWVIKDNHPGLWNALSNVWLVPVGPGAVILPIFGSLGQPPPCTPKIATVGPFGATATQTVEITGSCFGAGNTSSGADTAYFRISDLTAGWNACWTGDPNTDQVGCDISSWTDTTITFSGYTGDYGQNGWVVTKGDDIEVQVWNPQSGKGPATCDVVAGSSAPSNCSGSAG
jgi:hypothetical protein